MKRSRTPVEKKALSYANDRRNTVAESRSKAHSAISKRKVGANQALRRAQKVAVAKAGADEGEDAFVARVGRKSFQKIPDAPLSEYVSARLKGRQTSGMNKTSKESGTLKSVRKQNAGRPIQLKGSLQ